MSGYEYEVAEAALDAFAVEQLKSGNKEFYRAYIKFKAMLVVIAFVDFKGMDATQRDKLSWVWEDADVAFRGYGDSLLTGSIILMWTQMKKQRHKAFKRAITDALKAADEATEKGASRRYMTQWRDSEVRLGPDDFNLPAALPNWGPNLEEWAEQHGHDPAEVSQQFKLLEQYERETGLDPNGDKPIDVRSIFRVIEGEKP